MLDRTRKDRDYLWGRIFGELSLWMNRAQNLSGIQREVFIRDWDMHPMQTFRTWMERYMMTVVEAGAQRGDEDRRIAEIMSLGDADEMTDDSRLGADCHIAFYHEQGEVWSIRQQAMSEIGKARSQRKTAAARANGKKGGRPKKQTE